MSRKGWGILIAVSALGACALALGLVFYSRDPVLLVTDAAFEGIYGGPRLRKKQIETSLALFRRVKNVRVADAAGADVAAFAVEAAASRPYCVFFPYRYQAGALRYHEEFPTVPVLVFTGRIQVNRSEEGVIFVGADTETDYYRAGRCAAILAEGSEGAVLFLQDESLTRAERESFDRGLTDGGREGVPRYLYGAGDLNFPEKAACLVIAGAVGERFWQDHPDVPAILFSWVDPGATFRGIKVIFDDSPWALAAQAVKRIAGKETPPPDELPPERLPSEALILGRRLDKALLPGLEETARQVPQNEKSAD